jgi:hypothetical protein
MTTKEEEPKEIQEGENAAKEEEEKEEEEEEPIDLELQKEMKGLKISDSDFVKEPKAKKTQKKPKDPTVKKNKKKGQDFLDYANQNNIQINFEYEENKYQLKKTDDPKMGEKSNKYTDKKPFNKNRQNKYWQQKKPKMSGNKFDIGMKPYPHYNYQQQQNLVQLNDDKQIVEYLEKIFSEENLNKDLYLRNRIENGKILVDNVAKYNSFKNSKIEPQKIIDLAKTTKNLEILEEEGKNYIKIKDFDETKLKTKEQIYESRKGQKMAKMQYNNGGNQQFSHLINFQNNFIFYNNLQAPFNGYYPYNPQYMYPENK